MTRPTIKSYFSGAGLLEVGLLQANLDVIQSLEYDKDACKTHRENFSHTLCEEDITQKMVFSQQRSDVHAYTYPCTKYSTIADIHNARTGDELFLHAFRHTALELPEVFVIENVPGMRKFKIVMECFTKLPYYYTTVFCPVDAANWLPQHRGRLIIIGTRKPFSFSAPERPKRMVRLKHIIEKDANPHIPGYVFDRLNGKYRDLPIISDPEQNDIAPTCVAHYAKDRSTRLVKDKNHEAGVRPYTVREYARLQGVPDWFKFPVSENQAYKQIGNGVAVPVGRWIGKELLKYFNS
jgi:DNA (cytosine-5)-methyltransferase 1